MAFKHSENAAEIGSRPRSAAKMPLVGFVVAKKVCKSACARNRAKRRLREVYRHLRQNPAITDFSLNQWYALVWVVHEKGLLPSFQEIENTVVDCLIKADKRYGAGSQVPKINPPAASERQKPGSDGKDCKL